VRPPGESRTWAIATSVSLARGRARSSHYPHAVAGWYKIRERLLPTNLRIEHTLDGPWSHMVSNREVSGLTVMIEAELESKEGGSVADE
jgi:hypothetical protein